VVEALQGEGDSWPSRVDHVIRSTAGMARMLVACREKTNLFARRSWHPQGRGAWHAPMHQAASPERKPIYPLTWATLTFSEYTVVPEGRSP